VVREREGGGGGLDVEVEAVGEEMQVRQVSGADVGDPLVLNAQSSDLCTERVWRAATLDHRRCRGLVVLLGRLRLEKGDEVLRQYLETRTVVTAL
jgi:hypothetical protein